MAKSLVLGNGSLTVGFDFYGQVKDCYFDYVGQENHLSEDSINRIGVWVDGAFSWFADGSWDISVNYRKETLIGDIVAKNRNLELEIHITDCVYNESNIFIRGFDIINLANRQRTIRLFLNHEFRMYGVRKGDTVYWDPITRSIVHYKGRRIAIIGGFCGDKGINDYTVGLSGIEGKEGTWRDAEDGVLAKNAVEHGTVDSTIGFERVVDANDQMSVYTWVVFGKDFETVKKLNEYVQKRAPARLIETTENFWKAWVNKIPFSFYGLTEESIALFKKSLLILRVHVGNNGEIIASVDSDMLQWGRDNYNYVWPRDGAFVAMALDRANYSEVAHRFFEFANEVISMDGYFFHKYRPDRSLGSSWHPWVGPDGSSQLPIQEDETALVLIALWYHYEKTHNIEFIEKIYNSLIRKAVGFMVGFRNETKLPNPTYDLWEMKMGTHTFTTATVYQALLCVARFANLLGKEYDEQQYLHAAEEIKDAAKQLVNPKTEFFYKSIELKDGEILHDETIDASSFYGADHFGLFDEKTMDQMYEVFQRELVSREGVGGVIRFVDDAYFRANPSSKGNPWIVTTLWQAQHIISRAKGEADLAKVVELLHWVHTLAAPSGILPEQVDPVTGASRSASPLAWSHAEYVTTVLMYMEKLEELGICDVCPPEVMGNDLGN